MLLTLKKRGVHGGVLCGLVSCVVVVALQSFDPFHTWFNSLEMNLLDRRYRSSISYRLHRDLAIVGLDDKELRRFSPYPREVLAKVVRRLHQYGARVIALDILLDSRRPKAEEWEDLALLEAMARVRNVVLPAVLEENRLIEPHPFFRGASAGVGHSHGEQSPTDRVVRAFRPVLLPSSRQRDRSGPIGPPDAPRSIPSLSLVAVTMARQRQGAPQSYRSYREVARGSQLPLDEAGRLRLRFMPLSSVPVQPARELVRGELPANWFRDRIVFVGVTSPSFGDLHRTPFTRRNELGTPGVVLQALSAAALLDGKPLRDANLGVQLAVMALASALLGAICLLMLRILTYHLSLRVPMLVALLSMSLLLALLVGCFCHLTLLTGQWLFDRHALVVAEGPFLAMSILCLGASSLSYFFSAEMHARRMFGRYLHPQVTNEVLERSDPRSLLHPRSCRVTVLFSDIRDYTHLTANMTADQIAAMLNEYFKLMSEEVFKQKGFVDKYIGDGLMAVFGMFSDNDDGTRSAVRAAVNMRETLKSNRDKTGLRFRIGIGLHTGKVVAGEMGSAQHRSFTVLGAPVNLASRIEGMTKGRTQDPDAGILMTQAVLDEVQPLVEVLDQGECEIRGFEPEKFRLFELVKLKAEVPS